MDEHGRPDWTAERILDALREDPRGAGGAFVWLCDLSDPQDAACMDEALARADLTSMPDDAVRALVRGTSFRRDWLPSWAGVRDRAVEILDARGSDGTGSLWALYEPGHPRHRPDGHGPDRRDPAVGSDTFVRLAESGRDGRYEVMRWILFARTPYDLAPLDRLMAVVDPATLGSAAAMTFLRGSFHKRLWLHGWNGFRDRVAEAMDSRGEPTDGLLQGLFPVGHQRHARPTQGVSSLRRSDENETAASSPGPV